MCFRIPMLSIYELVFNWNHLEMRLLNPRINFFFFFFFLNLLWTFCPHLGSFCVVSSFTTFRPNFTSGLLQIGMLSVVTVSPVITAFHSCCLSHHVFDQVNLWPAWVVFETAIFWQCSPGTVQTQRLYPLRHGPRRAIKDGFFGLINPYLVFQSWVCTEFLYDAWYFDILQHKNYQDEDKKSAINKKKKKKLILIYELWTFYVHFTHPFISGYVTITGNLLFQIEITAQCTKKNQLFLEIFVWNGGRFVLWNQSKVIRICLYTVL